MKMIQKLLGTVLLLAAMFVVCSCTDNSPKGVATKSVKCLQNKDFKGYADLVYLKAKEGEDVNKQKEMVAGLLEGKYDKKIGKKDGIKSFEVLSEEVAEDGKTAVVKMKVVYGNGEEDNDEAVKLIKDDKGDWKLDAGK